MCTRILHNQKKPTSWPPRMAAMLLVVTLASIGPGAARSCVAQSPYATEIVAENATFGGIMLYNDPNSVLGQPTRTAVNNDPFLGVSPFHVSIIAPAYNRDAGGNKVVTTLGRKSNGAGGFNYGSITVKFDHPVVDDPANPYGIDLNIFGNASFLGAGIAGDSADMRSLNLAGGIFDEPIIVSVSPDNINWYTYSDGPFGDTAFPTQGHDWNADQYDLTGNGWADATQYTKPVNPALGTFLGTAGLNVADAMATYVGSGGGTGIDLASSGFQTIRYVRIESSAMSHDGEIDAFADVRPAYFGEALSITPTNVTANTPLYFQTSTDESHTSILVDFDTIDGLGKLTTAPVTNPAALGGLASRNVLATFQLDLLSFMSGTAPAFTANVEFSPGVNYAGNGVDVELLRWNGSTWSSLAATFSTLTDRFQLNNWSDHTSAFAIAEIEASTINGDFNGDHRIDAADYIIWRNGGSVPTDAAHYNAWRAQFGNMTGGGLSSESIQIPEPHSALIFVVIISLIFASKKR